MNEPATRRKTRSKRGPASPTLGRRPKFGSPVAQSSVHLRPDQRAWIVEHAAQRKAELGVDVSLSDVVRWAVDFYHKANDLALATTQAHISIGTALPESPATRAQQTHAQRAAVIKSNKEGRMSKA